MSIIEFENGQRVEFDGTPSQQDVDEVAKKFSFGSSTKTTSKPRTDTGLGAGTKTFGRGFLPLSKDYKKATQSQDAARVGAQKLIDRALRKPIGDPSRSQLLAAAQQALGVIGESSQELQNELPSNKQFIGGATETALTAALPGIGGGPAGAGAMNLVGRALLGGGVGYGFDVSGKLAEGKEQPFKPGLGTAAGGALPFVFALGSSLIKRGLGTASGAGKDVIQQAVDNPKAVGEAVKKYATTPEAKHELVDRAKTAISSYLRQRSQEYGAKVGSMTSAKPIPKQTVIDSFSKSVQEFGGRVKNGKLVFGDSTLTSTDQKNLQQGWELVRGWKDTTPQGFDKLRQGLGNLIKDFKAAQNPRASVVLGSVKTNLTNLMKENIEGYGSTLSEYGAKTGLAKNLLKELNLSGSAKASTQLNQILRLFKKDPAVMRDLVKVLGQDQADDLLNGISGSILSEWLPSGAVSNFGRIGLEAAIFYGSGFNPAALLPAVAASPRISGAAARLGGQAAQRFGTSAERAFTVGASEGN